MADTYHGILEGDRIRWIGPRPPSGKVRVIPDARLEADDPLPPLPEQTQADRDAMFDALETIADRGGLPINDPVAWQRQVRLDRPLPGRD